MVEYRRSAKGGLEYLELKTGDDLISNSEPCHHSIVTDLIPLNPFSIIPIFHPFLAYVRGTADFL
jgi:hypothetical protein